MTKLRIMRKIFLMCSILGWSLTLFSQSQYPIIEKLSYKGYYNWGIIWIHAGWVEFSLSKSDKYPTAEKLVAAGGTLPSWDWFFPIRDTLISHHDPQTFKSYEFSRKAHEGKYHKTFDYRFDYRDSIVIGDIHRWGKYKRQDTVKLLPDTYNMLSVAWMIRELDFEKYKKKDLIPVRILIDSKIYELYVRYLGVDKCKIDRHKYECYVFSPLLVEGEVFNGGENMKIWVSKDEYRLPLMMEAKILVGSVKAILNSDESQIGNME